MLWPTGCAQFYSSWSQRRLKLSSSHQVAVSISYHKLRFASAHIMLPRSSLFEIMASWLILMFRSSPVSCWFYRHASSCSNSCDKSGVLWQAYTQVIVGVIRLQPPEPRDSRARWIPQHLLRCNQSVMNAAARLVYLSPRSTNVTPLLRQHHWQNATQRIEFRVAILVSKSAHASAPYYLADLELCR